eukprot:gb/GFBE01070756.1/.p1 GENE.gb/GFBE01070756.1/~~gb/GFBE01070756.1/.p1  ORF type:complete len:541 (+),score=98.37 gb/GFBE01070756.1/:1-1623(+)
MAETSADATFEAVAESLFQQLANLRVAHAREQASLKAELAGLKAQNALLLCGKDGTPKREPNEVPWFPKHEMGFVKPVAVNHPEVAHEKSEGEAQHSCEGTSDTDKMWETAVQRRQSRTEKGRFRNAMKRVVSQINLEEPKRTNAEIMLLQVLGNTAPTIPDTMLERILTHPFVEVLVSLMIVGSSLAIGAEVQLMSHTVKEIDAFVVLDMLFTVFFAFECLLRLIAFGKRFFLRDDRNWNIFDMLLVTISLLDLILGATVLEDANLQAKPLKMLRILRVIRVFRFFRQLSNLAAMVLSSLRHLVWALALFFLIIYIVALTLTSYATEWLKQETNNFEIAFDQSPITQKVHLLFGNVIYSSYTLLMVALNGISWGEVTDVSIEINRIFTLILFCYITFSVIAVLNVFTGVFVDEALETKRSQLDVQIEQQIRAKQDFVDKLKAFFVVIDADGDGTVDLVEIQEMLQDENMAAYFELLGFEKRDADKMFELLDQDGSGSVSVVEFLSGCERISGAAKGLDIHLLLTEARRTSLLLKALSRG